MLLFIFRPASGIDPVFGLFLVVPVLVGGWVSAWLLQRFFLYRQQAAMLFLFSGRKPASPGWPAPSRRPAAFPRSFALGGPEPRPAQALFAFHRGGEERFDRIGCRRRRSFPDPGPAGPAAVSQAILTLAFSRAGSGYRALDPGSAGPLFPVWRGKPAPGAPVALALGDRPGFPFPLPRPAQLVFFQECRRPGLDRPDPGRGHCLAAAPGLCRPLCPGRHQRHPAGRDPRQSPGSGPA